MLALGLRLTAFHDGRHHSSERCRVLAFWKRVCCWEGGSATTPQIEKRGSRLGGLNLMVAAGVVVLVVLVVRGRLCLDKRILNWCEEFIFAHRISYMWCVSIRSCVIPLGGCFEEAHGAGVSVCRLLDRRRGT